jgi:hypothetical protein
MLQFKNKTPFPGMIYITPDENGIDTAYGVLKATYSLAAQPRLAEQQTPVVVTDEYYGDPARSSIKTAGDFSLTKPATDVLLQGVAFAPHRGSTAVNVGLIVADRINKVVRVVGDRTWRNPSIEQFETMPLVWERAAGAPERPENPAGCSLERPPNLEDPWQPVQSPHHRVAPAGFAPLGAYWEPRRSCAGTYDENWQRSRAPYLPQDFNPWFFQIAPRDQVVPGYLQGGEPVRLIGCSPEGQLTFTLPRHHVQFGFRMDSDFLVHDAALDTVVFDTAIRAMTLTWRARLACDKKALRISEAKVRVL